MRRVTVFFGLAWVLAGCSQGMGGCPFPDRPADTRGVITRSGGGSLMVEEHPEATYGSDKYRVKVKDATCFARRQNGKIVPDEREQPKVGDHVQVWFDGVVAESYPGQATADYILVEKE